MQARDPSGLLIRMPSGLSGMWEQPLKQGPLWGLHSHPFLVAQAGGRHGRDAQGNPSETAAPATWTQINQESRTEHTLGSVTMTISYRFVRGGGGPLLQ